MPTLHTDRVDAPFTAEQAASFNGFQQSGVGHPFTCPRQHLRWWWHVVDGQRVRIDPEQVDVDVTFESAGPGEKPVLADVVDADHVTLVATTDGLACPAQTCDYTQGWAVTFMLDGSWQALA